MFQPMALTVIFALVAAFVLSLTFVPAMVALCIRGRVRERENRARARGASAPTSRRCAGRCGWRGASCWPRPSRLRRRRCCSSAGSARSSSRRSTSSTSSCTRCRIPSTAPQRVDARCSSTLERAHRATFPEVAFVFSRTGTAEMATDPMPPNVSDTFIILKPRDEWPQPDATRRRTCGARVEAVAARAAGQRLRVHAADPDALQRADRRRARRPRGEGLRRRVRRRCCRRRERIAGVLREHPGAADMRVEQVDGPAGAERRRRPRARSRATGSSVADVQDVVAIAVGGRAAGQVFEGDRRFDIVVRLPDALRDGSRGAREPADPALARGRAGRRAWRSRPTTSRRCRAARPAARRGRDDRRRPRGRTRSAARTASAASSCRRTCAAATSARSSRRRRRRIAERGRRCRRAAGSTGAGSSRTSCTARARLAVVVPVCFLVILLLLYGTFGALRPALARLHRRAARAHRRHRRALAARHAVLDLGRGRLHRALGRRRPERARHGHVHQPAARGGRARSTTAIVDGARDAAAAGAR